MVIIDPMSNDPPPPVLHVLECGQIQRTARQGHLWCRRCARRAWVHASSPVYGEPTPYVLLLSCVTCQGALAAVPAAQLVAGRLTACPHCEYALARTPRQ